MKKKIKGPLINQETQLEIKTYIDKDLEKIKLSKEKVMNELSSIGYETKINDGVCCIYVKPESSLEEPDSMTPDQFYIKNIRKDWEVDWGELEKLYPNEKNFQKNKKISSKSLTFQKKYDILLLQLKKMVDENKITEEDYSIFINHSFSLEYTKQE